MTTLRSKAEAPSSVDEFTFREAVGHFASGVTVVAAVVDGKPVGFTCQSFDSVSVEPPLVSFSVKVTSTSFPLIRRTGRFAVSVLAHGQHDLSNQFACSVGDKWAGVRWAETRGGNPAIEGALTWFDCIITAEQRAGDHTIVVGEVVDTGGRDSRDLEPLLYFRDRYCTAHGSLHVK